MRREDDTDKRPCAHAPMRPGTLHESALQVNRALVLPVGEVVITVLEHLIDSPNNQAGSNFRLSTAQPAPFCEGREIVESVFRNSDLKLPWVTEVLILSHHNAIIMAL